MTAGEETSPHLHEPLSLYFCWHSTLTPGGNRICLKPPQKLSGPAWRGRGCCSPGKHVSHPRRASLSALLPHFPWELPWGPGWSFPSRLEGLEPLPLGWGSSLGSKSFFWTAKTLPWFHRKPLYPPCSADLPLLLHSSLLPSPITLHFFNFLLCCFVRPLAVALNPRCCYARNSAAVSRNHVLHKP